MIDLMQSRSGSHEPSYNSLSQPAVRSVGEKEEEFSILNNLRRNTVALLVHATLIVVAMIHTLPVNAQDADIAKQLQGSI